MGYRDYLNIIKASPLSFSLIKKILLISIVMIMITVSIQIFISYRSGLSEIQRILESINEVHVPSIKTSVYSIHEELLDSQLKGLNQLDYIVCAEVEENRGDKIFTFSAGDKSLSDSVWEYPLIHTSREGTETLIGTLKVYVSYRGLYGSIWQNASFILIENIVILLLLSIMMFLLVEKTITRHINRIAYFTNGISLSDLDTRLILDRKELSTKNEDEFQVLVKSINHMRLRLKDEERIKKQNQEEKEKLMVQIGQTQKMESIGRLAGGVAHDLNNLLTPILVFSELIEDQQAKDSPSREYAKGIMEAGHKAKKLIAQLLTFSKDSSGDFVSLELNEVINLFMELLERTIREDIKLKTELCRESSMILADKGQLEQVIMNLCINARDAMPKGGEISIETDRVELDETYTKVHNDVKPGPYIRLTVSDTGCGMPEDVQQHVFEPFYSTKGDAGTGLGLSTVYAIVRKHGGTIWLYSEKDKGTSFKLYFPASEAQATALKTEKQDKALPETGKETILVVEDSEQVLEITKAILTRQNYRVLSAENSMKGLEILEKEPGRIHLLLTDVILPDLNGKELYEKAKEIRKDIRVLFMSGYTNNIISVNNEGKDHFIQKPFTRKELITKLANLLS